MFLNYKVTQCNDCRHGNLMSELDKKIGALTKKLYDNIVFMTAQKCDYRKLQDLIHYKGILLKITMNPDYYKYKDKDIVSRIKTLI